MKKIEGYNKQKLKELMKHLGLAWKLQNDSLHEFHKIASKQDKEGYRVLKRILDLEIQIYLMGTWKAPVELLKEVSDLYKKLEFEEEER